jgi:hypothetical protein
MPLEKPYRRSAILADKYFADGPPQWKMKRGTANEQPAPTSRQTATQRSRAVKKLRWHGKHHAAPSVMALADKLKTCRPDAPCYSGACPICVRAVQRWLVDTSIAVRGEFAALGMGTTKVISAIPNFGRVPADGLRQFDWAAFQDSCVRALTASGIDDFFLGVDVSLNHNHGNRNSAYWQFQLWGFFHEPQTPWRALLVEQVNADGSVSRPIKVIEPDDPLAAAAYALKSAFVRRVSFLKANVDRDDRGQCWDTRDRILRGRDWAELMLFLDRIGIEGRLVIGGIASLHSQTVIHALERIRGRR